MEVNRILADGAMPDSDPIAFDAAIRVWCKDCDEKFRWIGVPYGLSPRQPRTDPAEEELRAPLRPASSDPDFGMGLPGFSMHMSPGEEARS